MFGSGDCIEPEDIIARMKSGVSGVYVGRGVLRNPWILAQARDLMEGRPARVISDEERGQFLLDYMNLLLRREERFAPDSGKALSRERWVINKIRALCSWYTKGFEGGAQFRIGVNSAKSIQELQDLIEKFFRWLNVRQPEMLRSIAGRKIGPAHPPLVVAEIGINHEGSLDVAKEMVDAAARAGVEVVKHQTHIVEDEMSGAARRSCPAMPPCRSTRSCSAARCRKTTRNSCRSTSNRRA